MRREELRRRPFSLYSFYVLYMLYSHWEWDLLDLLGPGGLLAGDTPTHDPEGTPGDLSDTLGRAERPRGCGRRGGFLYG
jgi:hypothetical protein